MKSNAINSEGRRKSSAAFALATLRRNQITSTRHFGTLNSPTSHHPDGDAPSLNEGYFFLKRRRSPAAIPVRPVPRSSMLAGSGVCTIWGGVAVVPNWITTLLNVELTVTPGTMTLKVTVPTKNGLCGLFPAMLPLAFAYVPLPVPPIIV